MAVAGDHVEGSDRQRQAHEHPVENQESSPLGAEHPAPERRQRQDHAEVQPEKSPEDSRVFRVRFDRLGVRQFGGVDGEERLLPHQAQPMERLMSDVGERQAEPVVRHFAGRERAAGSCRREARRVFALEERVAALRHEGFVGAGRPRVVPDVEVRSELRGRHQELAADPVVPEADGQQHGERGSGNDGYPSGAAARRRIPKAEPEPDAHHREQDSCVLAVEHEGPGGQAERGQPLPAPPRAELPQQREDERDQEDVDR